MGLDRELMLPPHRRCNPETFTRLRAYPREVLAEYIARTESESLVSIGFELLDVIQKVQRCDRRLAFLESRQAAEITGLRAGILEGAPCQEN